MCWTNLVQDASALKERVSMLFFRRIGLPALRETRSVQINNETAPIAKGDAVPILLTDVSSFENTGSSDLEFLIVGVAREKGKLDP